MILRNIHHFAAALLALVFLMCTLAGHPFWFLPILAACNALNLIYGEFSEPEIRQLLKFYYETRAARIIKLIDGGILIGVFGALFFYWNQSPRMLGETLGMGFLLGIVSGCFMVTLAHDLLHGHTKTERGMASVLLLLVGMPYFATDHLLGHHRFVGLQEDKTTAKVGQNFYHYYFSSLGSRLWHSYVKLYPMPAALQKKVGKTNRRMLLYNVLLLAMIVSGATQPFILLLLYVIQSFIASLLYELINYVQHYGLIRSAGRDAPVKVEHSWNCYYKYTNYILFLLPLHSQHHLHYHPGRETPLIGPKLPYVYFVMVFMALVPPWWFSKMDPLVHRLQKRSYSLDRKISLVKQNKITPWPKTIG